MKKAVMQNAGVNVYETYFDKPDSGNVLQCYRYPENEITVRLYRGHVCVTTFIIFFFHLGSRK